MLKKRLKQAILIKGMAIILLPSACTYAPEQGRWDRVPAQDYPQIAVLGGLHDYVFIADVIERPGPPLAVTVYARNNTADTDRFVQYRFLYYLDDGTREETDPDWHFMQMPARTKVEMSGNALKPEVASWEMEIRPAK